MVDLRVDIPLSRLTEISIILAEVNLDRGPLCPPHNPRCWAYRGLDPYTPEADECTECWLHWFIHGER